MKMHMASLVVVGLVCGSLAGQVPVEGPGAVGERKARQPVGGTLHAHSVHSATSQDGLAWTRDPGIRIEAASVPCAINDGDKRVLIYFVQPPDQPGMPETVACAASNDGLSFEGVEGFRIEGMGALKAVDPSILRDASGKFRLYYLASDHRGDPAAAPGPHAIHLAISDDGVRFREKGAVFRREALVDPDVFFHRGKWFMYVFGGGATVIATSDDGEAFAYAGDMSPPHWGTTAPVSLPGGRLRLYAFEQRVPSGNAVRSFLSDDGIQWAAEAGERIRAGEGEQITDPFVIRWRGGYKMYFKSSPARQFRGGAPAVVGQPMAPAGDARADGPWNRDVIAYRVDRRGEVARAAVFERAGVPTIARMKDGRLIVAHQHFPENDPANFDKVAVRFSGDEGRTWTGPQVIRVEGLPDGMRFPFDPTLVVLPDGRVRMYFTSLKGRRFDEDRPGIFSAISGDGVTFAFEPGMRFGVAGRPVIDCAAVLHRGLFHLFAPDNGTQLGPAAGQGQGGGARRPAAGIGYHATSKDGLEFTRADDVEVAGGCRWLGNAFTDGEKITFVGTADPGLSRDGQRRGSVWMATSREGTSWDPIPAPEISGGDPGAVPTRDGGLLVVITGESRRRAGAPEAPGAPMGAGPRAGGELRAAETGARYAVAKAAPGGSFVTGQDADIVLGARGFNESGGPLLFNHPSGLATDGKMLLVADRWNNRVLIWKSAPDKNSPADLVLGQPDFARNLPGAGRHQMNWPGNVATTPDGRCIAVADTENDRVLIWDAFPAKNGAAADVVLEMGSIADGGAPDQRAGGPRPGMRMGWPWGVWTDGKKLAVVATRGGAVLIWDSVPGRDNQPPDAILRPNGAGTPRNITSDGESFFAVSDHNHGDISRPATMVWRRFPSPETPEPDFRWGEWMKGSFAPDGRLILGGMQSIYIWDRPPESAVAGADVTVRPPMYRNGDGPDAVVANGRLYACNYNGNNLLAWNSIPARPDQPPDFAVGSDTPEQDTWGENFFIQNPVLATDGKSLFATSDFDRKMFVWRKLPDESGARPDLVYHLPEGPWDNELHGSTLALAGKGTVYVWRSLPLDGQSPDVTFSGGIGSVRFGEVTGVALDERHFYIADRRAGAIHVWDGIPSAQSEPRLTLAMRDPGRLNSDGEYLVAAPFEGAAISVWRVSDLGKGQGPRQLGGRGQFNLPGECLIAGGRLYVANRGFNRVDVWERVEDAMAGRPADALLGADDASDRGPGIGRNQLFMPGSIAWGGGYLWVGEFKFSTRILRYSPRAGSGATR